ncbi:MAG TPA: esterase-like activity of phytase family protein [Devosiaceae bacterium]
MKTTVLLGLLIGTALTATTSAFAQEATSIGKLSYLGEFVLPTGLKIAGTEFGGISGMDYDAASDTYYAISDDRSELAPARFYTLKLAIDGKGVHSVDILGSHELMSAAGTPFAKKDVDPESIRVDSANGKLYWSSEGDLRGKPSITEANLDGSFVAAFDVPPAYMPNADGTHGVRSNLAFEALTISADGKSLLAGTENALAQDGDKSTLDAGSMSRFIRFDLATHKPVAEYVYETAKIFTASTAPKPYNDEGMSEFLTFDQNTLITLERSFAIGVGNQVNLFVASLDGATDVNGADTIKGMDIKTVAKQKLLTIDEGTFGLDIDNVEDLTWGPMVDGKRTLIIASDNNFNPDGEFTQFVAFSLDPAAK